MNKGLSLLGIVALVLAAIAGTYFYQEHRIDQLRAENATLDSKLQKERDTQNSDTEVPVASTSYTSEKGVKATVTMPARDSKVTSPLVVTGSIPGTWAFEAEFLVRLVDADNKTITETPATLQGDWMTSQPVPFTTTLTFDTPTGDKGSIILIKANPSGLEEHGDTVTIPIEF